MLMQWKPKKLTEYGVRKSTNNKKVFKPVISASKNSLNKSFNFAYNIAYNNKHRNHRTGGRYKRRPTEIFVNTFLGKLCEFALYDYFTSKGLRTQKPDLEIYERGRWDSVDLDTEGYKITIKSTSCNGDLLLLEEKDWDSNVRYIPSNAEYDIFILVRTDYMLKETFKKEKKLFTDYINKKEIIDLCKLGMNKGDVLFDIPGWVFKEDIKVAINKKHLIYKDDILNKSTIMDATNYYIQTGDLREIEQLPESLRRFSLIMNNK